MTECENQLFLGDSLEQISGTTLAVTQKLSLLIFKKTIHYMKH